MEGCLKEVPDCGTKEIINMNGLCYKSSEVPGTCDNFGQLNQNWENPSYISTTPNTLLFDCLNECHNVDDCIGIHFSYNNSSSQNETTIPGSCQLVSAAAKGNLLPIPEAGYSCALNFKRSNKETERDCLNIQGNNSGVSIDMSSSKSPTVKKRILTKYLGAACRKSVANSDLDTDSNRELLQTMGNWCQENKDIDVCKTFCNNSSYSQFCNIQPNKFPIVMTIIFFVCIFFIIISAVHIKNKKIMIAVIICLIVGALISAYMGYRDYTNYSANQGYPGTKKDYSGGSTWQWTNSGCNVEKIYTGTYTNKSCCGSIGGGDPLNGTGKNKCTSNCTCDPKGKQNCPVWDQMYEATAIQPKDQVKSNVILGLRLYATNNYNKGGYAAYDNLVYIDAMDKGAIPITDPTYYGNKSFNECYYPLCTVTIGINATETKYKTPAGYALQSIQPYFNHCKMTSIQFNFASLWHANEPNISILWLGEPNCSFDKQLKCKGSPPGCCEDMPLIEGSICQTYLPSKPPKNVRWFVNNWHILWSNHDSSGGESGCQYFGLHRFFSVEFMGFESG